VTKIDLTVLRAVGEIAVELHPTAVLWDETRHRVYVANGNSDSISVIDSRTDKVVQTFAVRPFGSAIRGVAPARLALTTDGATLFVACGGSMRSQSCARAMVSCRA
jgi:YVTN family beta-propeller protein